MDYFIALSGFLGAWLLVTGPINQAAIELREEEFDHEEFDAITHSVQQPARVSAWWWLFPPAGFVKTRRRSTEYRTALMAALKPEQRKQSVAFLDKARGWMLVAAGAFFIAVKETWDVIELLHWPLWIFWALLVVMCLIAVGYTTLSVSRSSKVLNEVPAERTDS